MERREEGKVRDRMKRYHRGGNRANLNLDEKQTREEFKYNQFVCLFEFMSNTVTDGETKGTGTS